MYQHAVRARLLAWVTGIAFLLFCGWASADPPSRVARLGLVAGAVSFSPAGESGWFPVVLNRPLTADDRLQTDSSARAELEISGATVRLNGNTSVTIAQLDDQRAQLQLAQGTAQLRVRHLPPDQSLQINTPNVAFAVHQDGVYRISVNRQTDSTDIVVRQGQGEAFGESPIYVINAGQAFHFSGTGLRNYQVMDAPPRDEFEQWASSRDLAYDNSASLRYVAPDLIGYQALDQYGVWRDEPGYGFVWVPQRVTLGWAPYRDGHWVWIQPWGWTWVDDAPWGFAVSHYGRWAHLRGAWCWLPGPLRTRAFYAPALVAFEGGNNVGLSVRSAGLSGVAWFALGPREIYRPPYVISQDYFQRVNYHNAPIQQDVLTRRYNDNRFRPQEHVNRRIPGAVASALTSSFVAPNAVRPLAPVPEVRVPLRSKVEPQARTEQRPRTEPAVRPQAVQRQELAPRVEQPVRPQAVQRQDPATRPEQHGSPQRHLPGVAAAALAAPARTASTPAPGQRGKHEREPDEHAREARGAKPVNQR